MSKLAVDVVILPPDEIMDLSISLNRQLLEQVPSELVLSKDKCLPHITLAMGAAEESDLPKILQITARLAKKHLPINLRLTDVQNYERSDQEMMTALKIERSPGLAALHKEAILATKPFYTFDATPEMFIEPPFMDGPGSHWTSGRVYKNVLDKYGPHITLGYGRLAPLDKTIDFRATRMALCHLGKNSTCRKILFEYVVK